MNEIDKLKKYAKELIMPNLLVERIAEDKRDECDKKIMYATSETELISALDYASSIGDRVYHLQDIIDYYTQVRNRRLENKAKILVDKKEQAKTFSKEQPFFYGKDGSWWLWNSEERYYERVDEIDILNMISDNTGQDTINSKQRTEILNALKQQGRKQIPEEAPKSWVQFLNGVIDLEKENFELKEADPKYFMTNPINWRLGNEEDTPIIDKIFNEWVGKDKEKNLYDIIAYCMYRGYPIHRIFCLIGSGRNGKTTFLRLLILFLGMKNVCATELDTLITSRFEITRLHKKLAAIMGETNFNEISKTSILKKLCGEDLINFEYKNKTPFEDYNYGKIIVATNNLPTTTDKTIGFYSKWRIIDFPNLFPDDKDILITIPYIEFENLAFKCLKILKKLLQEGKLTNDDTIEERQKRYEDRSDPLEKFLKEFTIEDYDGFIWKHEFEERLNEWLKENRFREMAENTIGKRMKEKGINQELREADWVYGEVKRFRAWVGIKWIYNQKVEVEQVEQAEQVTLT